MRMERNLGKRSFWFASLVLGLFVFFSYASNSFGMQQYQTVDFSTGIVTASSLNVRQGPGLTYKISATLNKGEYVRVFAKIGNWYVIQTDADIVGAASADYIKSAVLEGDNTTASPPSTNQSTTPQDTTASTPIPDADGLTADEREVFNLINKERTDAEFRSSKNRCRVTEGCKN